MLDSAPFPQVLTIPEVIAFGRDAGKFSKNTVHRAVKSGALPIFRPLGTRIQLVKIEDLMNWLLPQPPGVKRGRGRPKKGSYSSKSSSVV
jgi:hypothetical protein